ncbi:MAG: response regulator [Mycoplasmatota bacterium]
MKDVNLLIENGVNVEKSLEILGDMEMYNETILDFYNGVGEKLAEIKKYKEIGDMPNYAILVHSLKSDAKYLGFDTLAQLSLDHEMKSKAGIVTYIYENYDKLMLEANKVLLLTKQYLTGEAVVTNKKQKIIVADDSNLIRNFATKILSDEYEVITAENGKEVIDFVSTANDGQISCLLLDLNMPVCSGFEVLDFFKENNLFTKMPVSIITGDDSKETIAKAFTYGIIDMLSKPFSETDAKRIVVKTINTKHY